jgi:hypothetical protein
MRYGPSWSEAAARRGAANLVAVRCQADIGPGAVLVGRDANDPLAEIKVASFMFPDSACARTIGMEAAVRRTRFRVRGFSRDP